MTFFDKSGEGIIIDDNKPTNDAIMVEPSLEDLFLYHFEEETQEEK